MMAIGTLRFAKENWRREDAAHPLTHYIDEASNPRSSAEAVSPRILPTAPKRADEVNTGMQLQRIESERLQLRLDARQSAT